MSRNNNKNIVGAGQYSKNMGSGGRGEGSGSVKPVTINDKLATSLKERVARNRSEIIEADSHNNK